MANEEQLSRLKISIGQNNNCKAWNEWRRSNPNERIDLSRSHLAGLNMNRANLFEANLVEARLAGSDLVEAHLNGANLCHADLSRCNLTQAFLSRAHLNLANLSQANLTQANLTQANLRESNLSQANFHRAYLSGADLRGAYVHDANFTNAYLSEVNFSEADLTNSKLSGVNLTGSIIGGIRGTLKQADSLICTYLEFSNEKGKAVLAFRDEKELQELQEYLITPNKLLSNLYLLRSKKERDPLLRIDRIQSEGEEYRIIQRMGAGSLGVSYLAIRKSDKQNVVLKIFDPDSQIFDFSNWETLRKRFVLEVLRSHRAHHPNFLEILDLGIWDFRPILIANQEMPRPFFVMEYIQGYNLLDFIKKQRPTFHTYFPIMLQLLKGIEHLHRQPSVWGEEFKQSGLLIQDDIVKNFLVHKNIKPQNIFISGNGEVVKLSELGVAIWKDVSPHLKALSLKGAQISDSIYHWILYMSPEQKEEGTITSKSDVFSLGLTFYYITTGQTFDKSMVMARTSKFMAPLNSNPTPQRLKDIILEMIRPKPEDRPDIRYVRQELEKLK